MPRPQFTLRYLLVAILVVGAFFGWLVSPIECPVCHGDNVDAEGRCRLGDSCPYYGLWDWWHDDHEHQVESVTGVPGHHLMENCLVCDSDGMIKRLDLMRSRLAKVKPLKQW